MQDDEENIEYETQVEIEKEIASAAYVYLYKAGIKIKKEQAFELARCVYDTVITKLDVEYEPETENKDFSFSCQYCRNTIIFSKEEYTREEATMLAQEHVNLICKPSFKQ